MKGCSRGCFLLILGGLLFAGAGYAALRWGADVLPMAQAWWAGSEGDDARPLTTNPAVDGSG